jgi:hypothetical protein
MTMIIAFVFAAFAMGPAFAGDHHDNNGAIVTHPDYGTRIVNDTWERQNQAPSGGPNQAFGMEGGPHETERHFTGGGSYSSEGGTVPKCSGPAFEGAC